MKKLVLSLLVSALFALASNPGDSLREMLDYVTKLDSKNLIANHIETYLDYKRIAADVAGRKAWLAANSDTKILFTNKLRTRLLNYYANNLLNLNKYRFNYVSSKNSKRQTIQIYNPNGSTSTLVVFYKNVGGKWLIIDSSYNGLSVTSYWRSKLASVIQAKGLEGI